MATATSSSSLARPRGARGSARSRALFKSNDGRLSDHSFGKPEILGENDVWSPTELPELRLELARLWMPARRGK